MSQDRERTKEEDGEDGERKTMTSDRFVPLSLSLSLCCFTNDMMTNCFDCFLPSLSLSSVILASSLIFF